MTRDWGALLLRQALPAQNHTIWFHLLQILPSSVALPFAPSEETPAEPWLRLQGFGCGFEVGGETLGPHTQKHGRLVPRARG